jgi:hypothetical protein
MPDQILWQLQVIRLYKKKQKQGSRKAKTPNPGAMQKKQSEPVISVHHFLINRLVVLFPAASCTTRR